MATAMDRGRDSATAGRLLENHTGGCAGAAGIANGSCASDGAELCRSSAAGGIGEEVDVRVEGSESAQWYNPLHDATDRLGHFTGAVERAAGWWDWFSGGQSRTGRD